MRPSCSDFSAPNNGFFCLESWEPWPDGFWSSFPSSKGVVAWEVSLFELHTVQNTLSVPKLPAAWCGKALGQASHEVSEESEVVEANE